MTAGVANSHAVERGAFPSSDDELREKRARFFAVSPASSSVNAAVAQSVECVLGKDEVTGSIPVSSSFDGAAHNRKSATIQPNVRGKKCGGSSVIQLITLH